MLGDGLHRHELGAFDSRDVVLERLADIDERELLAGIEAALDVFHGHFHRADYSRPI